MSWWLVMQGSRQPFAVRFGGPGIAGCSAIHAAVSRSYTPLRTQLFSASHAAACTAPLAPPQPGKLKRSSSTSNSEV